jgi:hypothetical protein
MGFSPKIAGGVTKKSSEEYEREGNREFRQSIYRSILAWFDSNPLKQHQFETRIFRTSQTNALSSAFLSHFPAKRPPNLAIAVRLN